MITVSDSFEEKQNNFNYSETIIDKLHLYRQYSGKIISQSGTTLVVAGDATDHFSADDYVNVPLDSFETDWPVASVTLNPANGDTSTDIVLTGSSWTDSVIGKEVCLKIDISHRLVQNGIRSINEKIEGELLSSFDSGKLVFEVDNIDGYFRDKDKTGILDTDDVYWGKYYVAYKGLDEDVLRYSGLLDLKDFEPNLYDKTIVFTILGHTKELERYPAWYVAETDNPALGIIPGIDLVSFTESDETEEGVKSIEYKPFTNSKLNGVTIESISNNTRSGIKILEFRYPYHFKWDNGEWIEVAVLEHTDSKIDGNGNVYYLGTKTLTSFDGSTVVAKFGSGSGLNEYPDEDTEKWISIRGKEDEAIAKEVGEEGSPVIVFDDGAEEPIRLHFQRVLDVDSGVYTDISDDVNIPGTFNNPVEILEDNADSILLVSYKPFYGIDILLSTLFSAGSLTIKYSTGGETFSSAMTLGNNGLVDGTSDFTSSGRITWTENEGWIPNNIIDDADTVYKGYMIEIKRTSATGTCEVYEIRNIIRAKGIGGDFLELSLVQNRLSTKTLMDEVVLRYKDDEWLLGTWYNNVTFNNLLKNALDEANYDSTKRTLADLVYSSSLDGGERFNIWGKPPRFNFPKEPECFAVDAANEIIWLGVGNELWSCEYDGNWEFVTEFKLTDDSDREYSIKMIQVSGTVIQCVLGTDLYHKKYGNILDEVGNDTEYYRYCMYNTVGGTVTEYDKRQVFPCLRYRRHGWASGGNASRMIGQDYAGVPDHHGGENICIPFTQLLTLLNRDEFPILYQRPNLYDGASTEAIIWRFCFVDGIWPITGDIVGRIYMATIGYYGIHAIAGAPGGSGLADGFSFKFSLGNQGVMINEGGGISMFQAETDDDADTYYRLNLLTTGGTRYATYYNNSQLPSCAYPRYGAYEIYFGFTAWNDEDVDDSVAYSYISRYGTTGTYDWTKAWKYDNTGTSYSDITSLLNAGTNITNAFTEANDAIYIGHSNKFRNALFTSANFGSGRTFAYEYWDGAAWSALPDTPLDTMTTIQVLTFTLPDDWVKNTVNGSNQYWVRIRATAISSSVTIANLQMKEEIVWDSQIDNSGDYATYSPVQIVVNNNGGTITVHGCMYNRDAEAASNASSWVYFAYDDSNGLSVCTEGDNYTYDKTYIYKNFVPSNEDDYVYCMAENIRYKDKPAYLVKGTYSDGTITLTKLGVPVGNEWGSQCQLDYDSTLNNVFGISRGNDFKLWEYGDSFYIRTEIAKFNDGQNIKNVLTSIAKINNCYWYINQKRNIIFYRRGTSSGNEILLKWDTNLVASKPTFKNWKHHYDSVVVNYKSIISEDSGFKKDGFTGWMSKKLIMTDSLVQNVHMADLLSEEFLTYFNELKLSPERLKIIYLIQYELLDKFTIKIPNDILDIDDELEFLFTDIYISSDKQITIKGLEI